MPSIPQATGGGGLVGLGALMLLVALGGCGFHLRGRSPLPKGVQSMRVTYNNSNYSVGDPVLVQTVRQRLRERGILGGDNAQATLAIQNVSDNRQVTSVTPRIASIATYSVTTSVTFSYSVGGATKIAGQTLSISREYTLNETQRLASNSERNNLYHSMQKQLVEDIFLRIAQYNHNLVKSSSGRAASANKNSSGTTVNND